jgi:hypothetical protein
MSGFVYSSGGSSSGTPVDLNLSPHSGTPSSIANGATLDATMLDGWKVWDPSGYFGGSALITDDGAKMTVKPTGGATNSYTGSGLWTNASLYYPHKLTGDFTASLKYAGEASMGTNQSWCGIVAGNRGNSSPRASYNGASAGFHTNSARDNVWTTALSSGTSSSYYTLDTSAIAWATPTWMQLSRRGSVVTMNRKTLDGDDWIEVESDSVDVIGADFTLSLTFRPTALLAFYVYAFELSGTQATE